MFVRLINVVGAHSLAWCNERQFSIALCCCPLDKLMNRLERTAKRGLTGLRIIQLCVRLEAKATQAENGADWTCVGDQDHGGRYTNRLTLGLFALWHTTVHFARMRSMCWSYT